MRKVLMVLAVVLGFVGVVCAADGLSIKPSGPAIPVNQTQSGGKYIAVSGTLFDLPQFWFGGYAYVTITDTGTNTVIGYTGDVLVTQRGSYQTLVSVPNIIIPSNVEILVQIYDDENQFQAGGTVSGLAQLVQ